MCAKAMMGGVAVFCGSWRCLKLFLCFFSTKIIISLGSDYRLGILNTRCHSWTGTNPQLLYLATPLPSHSLSSGSEQSRRVQSREEQGRTTCLSDPVNSGPQPNQHWEFWLPDGKPRDNSTLKKSVTPGTEKHLQVNTFIF